MLSSKRLIALLAALLVSGGSLAACGAEDEANQVRDDVEQATDKAREEGGQATDEAREEGGQATDEAREQGGQGTDGR